MAGGLAALLDDVAMIAKMASSASSKAIGVVVDDSAVTPRYVYGFSPARELPIIWQIAKGSLRNKLVFILPIALALSQFAPMLLPPILMLGGTYLCFEGAEKLLEYLTGKHKEKTEQAAPVIETGSDREAQMVRGAITTDLILSAEIMVISLNQIADADFWLRLFAMILVAVFITALVYGVVALIVKMDDIGLRLTKSPIARRQRYGHGLVAAMPKVMAVLSAVGVVAMLWVGGHILIVRAHDLGWDAPYALLHTITDPISAIGGAGGFLAWLVDTLISAVVGFLVGLVVVGIMHLLPFGHHRDPHEGTERPDITTSMGSE